jgi:hypothetical protein
VGSHFFGHRNLPYFDLSKQLIDSLVSKWGVQKRYQPWMKFLDSFMILSLPFFKEEIAQLRLIGFIRCAKDYLVSSAQFFFSPKIVSRLSWRAPHRHFIVTANRMLPPKTKTL